MRGLPGSFETGNAVLATLSDIVLYHRTDDYPQKRATRIGTLGIDQLTTAVRAIPPTALTWIIVGDLKKIEAPVRALELGDLKVVDPDGHVIH